MVGRLSKWRSRAYSNRLDIFCLITQGDSFSWYMDGISHWGFKSLSRWLEPRENSAYTGSSRVYSLIPLLYSNQISECRPGSPSRVRVAGSRAFVTRKFRIGTSIVGIIIEIILLLSSYFKNSDFGQDVKTFRREKSTSPSEKKTRLSRFNRENEHSLSYPNCLW
jgi:hypothetical protein